MITISTTRGLLTPIRPVACIGECGLEQYTPKITELSKGLSELSSHEDSSK